MGKQCCLCDTEDMKREYVSLTIVDEDGTERTRCYCWDCSAKYLNMLDMMGMTTLMLRAVQNSHPAAPSAHVR